VRTGSQRDSLRIALTYLIWSAKRITLEGKNLWKGGRYFLIKRLVNLFLIVLNIMRMRKTVTIMFLIIGEKRYIRHLDLRLMLLCFCSGSPEEYREWREIRGALKGLLRKGRKGCDQDKERSIFGLITLGILEFPDLTDDGRGQQTRETAHLHLVRDRQKERKTWVYQERGNFSALLMIGGGPRL